MNTAEITSIPPTAPPTAPPMTAALTEPAGLVDDAEAEAEVDVEIDEVELGRAVEAVVDGRSGGHNGSGNLGGERVGGSGEA
jgi:hypothetical protein